MRSTVSEPRCPDCGWSPVPDDVCDGCLADLGEHRSTAAVLPPAAFDRDVRFGDLISTLEQLVSLTDEHPIDEVARVGRRASEMLVVLRSQFLDAIGVGPDPRP